MNGSPIWAPPQNEWRLLRGRKAFAATAGNGAVGTVALFDVTGQVEIRFLPAYCSESLAGAGTLALGWTSLPNIISSLYSDTIADATTLDLGDWWGADDSTTGAAGGNNHAYVTFVTSESIILTVGSTDITDGQLDFFIWWRPLSADGNLALATGMTAI